MRAEIIPFSNEDEPTLESITTNQTIKKIIDISTVAPRTVVRRNRFTNIAPYSPVYLVSSELTMLRENENKGVSAIIIEHQLSRKSSVELGLNLSENSDLQEVFNSTLESRENKHLLEAENEEINLYNQKKEKFDKEVREAPYKKVPDLNLRYRMPVPPISLIHEKIYSRQNGVGWSGENEVIAALSIHQNSGASDRSFRAEYLSGDKLDYAIKEYRNMKKDEWKKRRLQNMIEMYSMSEEGVFVPLQHLAAD